MPGEQMARGAVALWLVPRAGAHRDPRAEAAELSPAARERINALRTPDARDGQLLSRAWLARMLRAYFGPASAGWTIGVDCKGCAVLRDAPPEIAIAFAHGRDRIAIAIGHDCGPGLGIDLEDRLDRDDPLLAPVILAPAELERYHRLATGKRRRQYLLVRWVAKEAYVKARRVGLAMPFDTIEVIEAAPGVYGVGHPAGLDGQHWQVRLLEPSDDLAIAVAWAPTRDTPLALTVHSVDELPFERDAFTLIRLR